MTISATLPLLPNGNASPGGLRRPSCHSPIGKAPDRMPSNFRAWQETARRLSLRQQLALGGVAEPAGATINAVLFLEIPALRQVGNVFALAEDNQFHAVGNQRF